MIKGSRGDKRIGLDLKSARTERDRDEWLDYSVFMHRPNHWSPELSPGFKKFIWFHYFYSMELTPKPELQQYFDKKAYLKKVLLQINRDFEMAGCDFELPKNEIEVLEELQNILTINLEPLMKENGPRLKNLLYRIDVSEKSIYRGMSENTDLQLAVLSINKIIERELLKILIREKYSL